jgi:hypothetical protein
VEVGHAQADDAGQALLLEMTTGSPGRDRDALAHSGYDVVGGLA